MTQGDPIAMPVYAIGVTSLLASIKPEPDSNLRHAAFADDLGGAGKVQRLRVWWDRIVEVGSKLGSQMARNRGS